LAEVEDNRLQYIGLLQEVGYIEGDYKISSSVNQNADDFRVVKGAIVAGLYPNIAKIKSPPQKYVKTANGALAVDADPSELKFFDFVERVFLHPASFNFECGKFSDSFLAYFLKIQTGKVYLRDSTCISAWPIVLFGGNLKLDHNHNIITLDDSIKIEAFPRISGIFVLHNF
jgi:ATP-dependent RNA helicase DHX57